jgi:hypothetical protein
MNGTISFDLEAALSRWNGMVIEISGYLVKVFTGIS